MKKLFVALAMVLSLPAIAQPVSLACQGQATYNATNKKFPNINVKNRKEWVMLNVVIEPDTNSIVIGDSYYSDKTRYPDLRISDSHYVMHYWIANPNREHAYYSIMISVDRFTGSFKYSNSDSSKDGNHDSKTSISGTCQIGVQWQQKF
jgi:hypothetical protein